MLRRVDRRLWTRGLLVLVFVVVATFYGLEALDTYRSLRALNRFTSLVIPATSPPPDSRILILQHIGDGRSTLERASHEGHKAYATAWGYDYRDDRANYVDGRIHGTFNKMFVLRKAMATELAKRGRGAQWIFYCDADTIITDPSVGLHLLLPPTTLDPTPLLVAGQDHNGLNAGVLAIRVTPETLAYVDDIIDAGSKYGPYMDQHYLGLALRNTSSVFGSHFYEIPRRWINAYFFDDGGHETARGGHGWDPLLQVHLVNHLKFKFSPRPMLEHCAKVAEQAAAAYRQSGSARTMFDALPQKDWTIQRARSWWHDPKPGIARMRFLDDIEGPVDGPEYTGQP